MLYLPPHWAHDGVAVGECMTASVGFRAPGPAEVAREMLLRLADAVAPAPRERLYDDAAQAATSAPGAVPLALHDFAAAALHDALRRPQRLARTLGEWLTEPKAQVWFDSGRGGIAATLGVVLDRRTRMLYDARHVFINGESFRAGGLDARWLRRLADQRRLSAAELRRCSAELRTMLDDWARAGWLGGDSGAAQPR